MQNWVNPPYIAHNLLRNLQQITVNNLHSQPAVPQTFAQKLTSEMQMFN